VTLNQENHLPIWSRRFQLEVGSAYDKNVAKELVSISICMSNVLNTLYFLDKNSYHNTFPDRLIHIPRPAADRPAKLEIILAPSTTYSATGIVGKIYEDPPKSNHPTSRRRPLLSSFTVPRITKSIELQHCIFTYLLPPSEIIFRSSRLTPTPFSRTSHRFCKGFYVILTRSTQSFQARPNRTRIPFPQ
jgi:hypothetical protein